MKCHVMMHEIVFTGVSMKTYLMLFLLFLIVGLIRGSDSQPPLIGAQVFIEPGQSRENIEKWFHLLSDHHMPVCRIRMFEDHMRKPDGSWDFSLYDFAFDMADKYHVKILATLFPSDNTVGGFKFPRNQSHFESIQAYIDKTVTHFRDHPALETWVLMNEPGSGGFYEDAFSVSKYQEWKKRQTVPEVRNGFMKINMDWPLFWRDYTTWYLQWIAEQVRMHDAKSLTHVNNHQLFMLLAEYNFPQWMPFLNTLGASIHAAWHLGYFERDQYTMAIAANCDIIRCASDPKPFWITELQGGNNIFSGMDPLCPDARDIAQWVWTGVGCGAERIIFWTLNPRASGAEAGEWGMVNFQNEPSERLTMSGEIARIIEEHGSILAGALPVIPEITLLYSPESMIMLRDQVWSGEFADNFAGRKAGAHIKSLLAYYEVIQELGLSCHVKQMDHFDWKEGEGRKRIAILPNMLAIPHKHVEDLYAFVEKGNKLIVTGMSGYFDENMHNVNQSSDPFSRLLGASLREYKFTENLFDLQLDDPSIMLPAHMLCGTVQCRTAEIIGTRYDEAVAVRNRYQKGEVVWIPSLMGLGAWLGNNESLARFVLHEAKDSIENTPFQFTGHESHVYMKVLKTSTGYVTVLVNANDDTREIKLAVKRTMTPSVVFGESEQKTLKENKVRLEPQGTLVIHWKK
jgi:beta-galactosidase